MATDQEFIAYIMDQISELDETRYRKMFGEYAIYYRDKVMGLVCDNQMFMKITEAGKRFITEPIYGNAYPGAKESFLLTDKLDDSEWICELFRISEPEIALPKKRKKKNEIRH